MKNSNLTYLEKSQTAKQIKKINQSILMGAVRRANLIDVPDEPKMVLPKLREEPEK